MIENDRTLVNILSSPQERLDAERNDARIEARQAALDLERTLQQMRILVYNTGERLVQLEEKYKEAAEIRDALWEEKIVKPAAGSPVRRKQKGAVADEELPANVNPNDYERFQSADRRCDELSASLALLQRQRDFFATYNDTLCTAQVLQDGAAVMAEVVTKFNQNDARELHEKYDLYTQQLRDITQEFAKLHQTSVIGAGESAPRLQSTISATFRPQDARRLQLALRPAPVQQQRALPMPRHRPPPPSMPETMLDATALDSHH